MGSTNINLNQSVVLTPIDKVRHAPPRASAMLESLRGLGYSTAAALADIIDNSISASASTIDIQFNWNGKSSRYSFTRRCNLGWYFRSCLCKCKFKKISNNIFINL